MILLERVKEHLRVDHNDEDILIRAYLSAAEEHIKNYCDCDIDEIAPEIATAAALLIVGDLYQHRAAQGSNKLYENETVDRLLSLHRRLSI